MGSGAVKFLMVFMSVSLFIGFVSGQSGPSHFLSQIDPGQPLDFGSRTLLNAGGINISSSLIPDTGLTIKNPETTPMKTWIGPDHVASIGRGNRRDLNIDEEGNIGVGTAPEDGISISKDYMDTRFYDNYVEMKVPGSSDPVNIKYIPISITGDQGRVVGEFLGARESRGSSSHQGILSLNVFYSKSDSDEAFSISGEFTSNTDGSSSFERVVFDYDGDEWYGIRLEYPSDWTYTSDLFFRGYTSHRNLTYLDGEDVSNVKNYDNKFVDTTFTSGRVGIGSSNPDGMLDVNGSTILREGFSTDGDASLQRSGTDFIQFEGRPSINLMQKTRMYDNIDMRGNNLSNVDFLGVGTGSSDHEMEVQGTIGASRLTDIDDDSYYLNPAGRSVFDTIYAPLTYDSTSLAGLGNIWHKLDEQGVSVTVEDSNGNTYDPAPLFDRPGHDLVIDSSNFPVTITIDFGQNEHYNSIGAIGFQYHRSVNHVKIDIQNDDGSWFTHVDRDNKGDVDTFVWPRWGSHKQKFEITLSDPTSTAVDNGHVRISNLAQHSYHWQRNPSGNLLYAGGDNMYGNLDMNSNDINDVGTLNANTKNFVIDHPLEPEEKKLRHSVVEGPERAVFYRGESQLEDGEKTVELPDYFEELTREEDRTIQLTAKGKEPYALSYEPITDGKFKVHGTKGDGRFSWEVKAQRADKEPLKVEEEK